MADVDDMTAEATIMDEEEIISSMVDMADHMLDKGHTRSEVVETLSRRSSSYQGSDRRWKLLVKSATEYI